MPHFTGKPTQTIRITGYVFPWYSDMDQPVLLHNPLDEHPNTLLLPIFSTAEKMREAMIEWLTLDRPWKVKMIEDGCEFIASLQSASGLIIAADPHLVDGNVRFLAVYRGEVLN